jgi:DNA-binding transcriptional MerR regulator
MKYLTTLEVAHELKVSKQTLLNWLYGGKIPEPPRNRQGYRLWSPSRVSLVKRLIVDGRLNRRTVVHRDVSNEPEVVTELAREVLQFLRDGQIDLTTFVRELQRVSRSRAGRKKKAAKKASSPRTSKR